MISMVTSALCVWDWSHWSQLCWDVTKCDKCVMHTLETNNPVHTQFNYFYYLVSPKIFWVNELTVSPDCLAILRAITDARNTGHLHGYCLGLWGCSLFPVSTNCTGMAGHLCETLLSWHPIPCDTGSACDTPTPFLFPPPPLAFQSSVSITLVNGSMRARWLGPNQHWDNSHP